jgi:hypothetical protein
MNNNDIPMPPRYCGEFPEQFPVFRHTQARCSVCGGSGHCVIIVVEENVGELYETSICPGCLHSLADRAMEYAP